MKIFRLVMRSIVFLIGVCLALLLNPVTMKDMIKNTYWPGLVLYFMSGIMGLIIVFLSGRDIFRIIKNSNQGKI